MASLQDRRVKEPKRNRGYHLDAGQWMTGKKTAHDPYRVKRKTPPQQARDRCEQIRYGRQVIKDRMQLVRLELALLQQIHHASDASERERTIGHQRNRRVKLQPGIRGDLRRMPNIDWRN